MKRISISIAALLLLASATAEPCAQKHGIELHDYHGRTILPAHTCNNFLNASVFYNEPDVVLPGLYTNYTQKYTLMLLEKHNVPREVYRLHWLLANISPLNHSLVRNRTSLALYPYSRPIAPNSGYSNYTLTVYKQNMSGPLIVTRPSDAENFWPDVWIHSLGTSVAKEYTRTWFRINGTSAGPRPPSAAGYPSAPYPPPPPQVGRDTVGSLGWNNHTYGNHSNGSYPYPPPPYRPHPLPPPYHPQPVPPYHPQPVPPYHPQPVPPYQPQPVPPYQPQPVPPYHPQPVPPYHTQPNYRPHRNGAVTHYVEFSLLLAPFLFLFYFHN